MKVGAVMVSDDLELAMRRIHGMQKLLKMAEAEAQGDKIVIDVIYSLRVA